MTVNNDNLKLFKILHPTEEDRYRNFFTHDIWTPIEFGALASGIDPTRLQELLSKEASPVDSKEDIRAARAVKFTIRFLKDTKKMRAENPLEPGFLEDNLNLPCCKYIQWIAEEAISVTYKFLKSLPLNYLELLEVFEPINKIARYGSIYSTVYHKTILQKHAEALLKKVSPKKMRHSEIYKDPSIQNVLSNLRAYPKSIQRHEVLKPVKKSYPKRTILDWITKVNPDSPKGGSNAPKKPKLTVSRKK